MNDTIVENFICVESSSVKRRHVVHFSGHSGSCGEAAEG